MVNIATISKSQARREVSIYRQVQRFWNSGGESAIIGNVTFTRFTASRHLSLNGPSVARYLEALTEGIIK